MSSESEASTVRACMEGMATGGDVEAEVVMNKLSTSDGVEAFSAPVSETSAVVPVCQRETGEMGASGEKQKVHMGAYGGMLANKGAEDEVVATHKKWEVSKRRPGWKAKGPLIGTMVVSIRTGHRGRPNRGSEWASRGIRISLEETRRRTCGLEGHGEEGQGGTSLPTPVLESLATMPESKHKTKEMEEGDESADGRSGPSTP